MEKSSILKRKKDLSKQKLEEISKKKDQSKLLNLYEDLLKINNTEKAIVLNYLQFIKKLYEKDSNKKIEIFSNYINHFSPKEGTLIFLILL